jgi:hypothetical protein
LGRKWHLQALETWELPVPTPALWWGKAQQVVETLGPNTYVISIPGYYDIPTAEDIRQIIRCAQEQQADTFESREAFPVTDTSPRKGRPSKYESAFRLYLIELALRSRYGSTRGMVERLCQASSSFLDIGIDRFRALRKQYSPWLKQA